MANNIALNQIGSEPANPIVDLRGRALSTVRKGGIKESQHSAFGIHNNDVGGLKRKLSIIESSNNGIGAAAGGVPSEQWILNEVLKDETHCDHSAVSDVFLLLSLCHSIVIDKRTGKLNSSSPDELALVEGAQLHGGYSFEGKDGDGIIVIRRKRDQELLKYHLLNVLEFTSTRKRMSVIIRDL